MNQKDDSSLPGNPYLEEMEKTALRIKKAKKKIDEQEERVLRFGIGLYLFANILWLLVALAFIITGAVLGGLGIIGTPALAIMVTIGCILLISLILANCLIFSGTEPTNNVSSSSNSYGSLAEDDLRRTPSPSQTASITPTVPHTQQNPEIYQDLLQPDVVPTPTLPQETAKNNSTDLTATFT
jgi:hypothetical protein